MHSTRLVAVALGLAVLLPAQGAFSSFDPTRLPNIGALLRREVEAGHEAGASFLLLQHDHEVAFEAFGRASVAGDTPMRRDTIVRLFSMTKAVTAVAALLLFEHDDLRLDSPIEQWLPELKNLQVLVGGTADAPQLAPIAQPITVRMLLNHTAGFTYDFFQDSPVQELYRRADLWSSNSLDEFLQRVAKLPLLSQPGAQWNYSIADDVLGVLIQRAAAQPFDRYVKEHVTAPLDMVDTDFSVPAAKLARLAEVHTIENGRLKTVPPSFGVFAEPGRGFPEGGSGLFSTLDDYAKFCGMLLGNGEYHGVHILGRKTMELARLDSLRGGQHTSYPGDGWGLICAVHSDPAASPMLGSAGMLSWSGAAGTHFFVDAQEGIVAVLFCQHFPFDPQKLIPRFHTAVYSALR